MPTEQRQRGRARGWLRNPVAAVALLALLVADTAWLATRHWHESAAGNLIYRACFGPRYTCGMRGQSGWYAFVHEGPEDGGLRVDFLEDVDVNRLESLGHVWFSAGRGRQGLWAPTRERSWARVGVIRTEDAPPFDAADARARYVGLLERSGDPRHRAEAALIADGDVFETSILWPGHLHNLAALAALAGFLYAAPSFAQLARAARRRSRIAAGLCPICRYDLAGLPGPVCPECGGPVREVS